MNQNILTENLNGLHSLVALNYVKKRNMLSQRCTFFWLYFDKKVYYFPQIKNIIYQHLFLCNNDLLTVFA